MERRRGARIPARFWAQLSGVDTEPVLRRGDISMSGAYIEIDDGVGPPGSVQTLWVAPHSREDSVRLLARVVRVVSIRDLWHDGSRIAGVAFEFLPEAAGKREVLTRVIRHILASRSFVADSVRIDSGFDVRVSAAGEDRLIVRAMVLDTTWPVQVGDAIDCEVSGSGRRAKLSGRIVRAAPEGTSGDTRVDVAFEPAASEATLETDSAGSISAAMDTILEDVVFPQAAAPPAVSDEPMRGSLERVSVAELIAFLEVGGVSGVLRVDHDGSAAMVHLRDGMIVDVDMKTGPEDPRAAIALVCSFVTGEFEFSSQAVERPDRVGAPIAELLATPL